jgi:hypothetical protein
LNTPAGGNGLGRPRLILKSFVHYEKRMATTFNNRERFLMELSAAVFVVAAIGHMYIVPIITKNQGLDEEIRRAVSSINENSALLRHKDLFDIIPSVENEGHDHGSDPMVGILSNLENLAKTAGVAITDIRPQNGKSSKKIEIEIKMEGTMKSFFTWIYSLEHSASPLAIKKLQLAQKSNGVLEGSFLIENFSSFTE